MEAAPPGDGGPEREERQTRPATPSRPRSVTRPAGSTVPAASRPAPETVVAPDELGPAARLVPADGEPATPEIPLTGRREVIGRDYPATIRIDHAAVSGEHAAIEFRDNAWHIAELKAKNPLKVNGNRVTEATLKDGDRVKLGAFTYVFRCTAAKPKPRKKWMIAAALFLFALVLLLLARPSGDGSKRTNVAPPDLVKDIKDSLYELNMKEAEALIEKIEDPARKKALEEMKRDVDDALKAGGQLTAAITRYCDAPSSEAFEGFSATQRRFTALLNRLDEAGIPEKCDLHKQLDIGKSTISDGNRAIALWDRLIHQDILDKRVEALGTLSEWVRSRPASPAAQCLAKRTDAVETECFEKAMAAFDFDTARKCIECAHNPAVAQDQDKRRKAETDLVETISAHAQDWYKVPIPVKAQTLLNGLVSKLATAVEWSNTIEKAMKQTPEELQRAEPNTAVLMQSLDTSLRELAQLARDVKDFPAKGKQPPSLEFLAKFRDPADEWDAPVKQVKALLEQWPLFKQTVKSFQEKPILATFHEAMQRGRQAHLAASRMADKRVQPLAAPVSAEILTLIKPCLEEMLAQAAAERKLAKHGAEAGILRAITDCTWSAEARAVVSSAEERLAEIEVEGKRFAIRAYLYVKLGEPREAEADYKEALAMLGNSHPWMAKLKP